MTDQEQQDQQDQEQTVEPTKTYAVYRLRDTPANGTAFALTKTTAAPEFVGYHQVMDSYRAERESIEALATQVGRYVAVYVHTTEEDDYYGPGYNVTLEVR